MSQKPFAHDSRRRREPLQLDRQIRALRLEQTFSEKALPSKIDAIVIGSGAGGLATAAILAKSGRKVVVLEKYSSAGGSCNGLNRGGYEWDMGVHYVGLMGPNNFERFFLDQLTEGQLDWQKMEADYDNLVFVKSPNENVTIPIVDHWEKVRDDMIKRYPEHEKALREYYGKVPQNGFDSSPFYYFTLVKTLPVWMANFSIKTGLHKIFASFIREYNETSVKMLLDKMFGEGVSEMKTALGYSTLLHDVELHTGSAGMSPFHYSYFDGGAYYPVGGPTEIPYTLIPTIEKAGGRVFVNANVTEIVLKGHKAVGVRVATSSGGSVEVKAPVIISDAGVSNTFRKLLPKEVVSQTKIGQLLESGRIHPSRAFFQVFVGLKGSQEEFKLPAKNILLIYETDWEKLGETWYNLDLETAAYKAKIPVIIVDFSSAKDPSYKDRFPGRSVCTILTPISIDWYRKWKNETGYSRSEDCEAAEMELAKRFWNLVIEAYPHLADCKDFICTGSPLWMMDSLNAYAGEPYGLDNGKDRYAPDVGVALRPEVPEIADLYLTGQDVLSFGLVTVLYSAIYTGQAILKRYGECSNLLEDVKHSFNKFAKK